jgi:hypothetical protein
MLDDYIFEYNVEGKYAGNIEYAAIYKLFNIRIVLLNKGFINYIILF